MIDEAVVRARVEGSLDRIRRHPFIRAANAQELSFAEIIRWVMCAGRESRSFPDILRNMLSWSHNPVLKATLAENLDDELGNGHPEDAHFRHYLALLGELGLAADDFYAYDGRPGIGLALSMAYNVSLLGREAPVMGYMLVNEAMTPITYGAVKTAVARHRPALVSAFFDLHVAIDEVHVAGLYRVLPALPPDALDDLLFGVELGERGMAALLDEAIGVFDACPVPPPVVPERAAVRI